MKRIRILLADDHAVVRQGFKMILSAQPDMEIVGEAGNGREAVELAEQLQPDIVVMDVAMPELNGIEATRRLAAPMPHTRVVALSMHKDSVYVREILRAGARGYLLKDSPAPATCWPPCAPWPRAKAISAPRFRTRCSTTTAGTSPTPSTC